MKRWFALGLGVVILAAFGLGAWAYLAERHRANGLERQVRTLRHTRDDLAARNSGLATLLAERHRALRKLHDLFATSQPCGRFAEAHTWFFPNHGPPGTTVRFVGDCFLGPPRLWRQPNQWMFLLHLFLAPKECELIIDVRNPRFHFDGHGRAHGSFIVPAGRGICFQEEYRRRLTPGTYSLGIGCHACGAGEFRVTAS